MSPESVDGRIGRSERELATLHVQMIDAQRRLDRYDLTADAVAELKGALQLLSRDVHGLSENLGAIRQTFQADVKELRDEFRSHERRREEEEEQRTKDAKANRRVMWSLIAAVAGAVITGVAGIIAALVGAG